MTGSYDEYLARFAVARNGRATRNLLFNGHPVALLDRREFYQRAHELEEKVFLQQHLNRRDHTVPFALERTIQELWAQLLLPGDHRLASVRRSLAA